MVKLIYFQPEDRVNMDIQKAQLYAARAAKKSFKQKKLKIFADDDITKKGMSIWLSCIYYL